MNDMITNKGLEGIAVIGMSCRFPGARNISEFWENLKVGKESVSFFSDDELRNSGVDPSLLNNANYVKASPIMEGADLFDASFFGITPTDAMVMDPQHRVFLECAWETLENSGYNPGVFDGAIGIFAGCSMNHYILKNLISNRELMDRMGDLQTFIGNDKDFLTTRVSYHLNLRGPSIDIQTACSTSLVAVQLACQSLLTYESDMVLAGGVTVKTPQKAGYLYKEGEIASPDGHCRAFDHRAHGTIFGEGVGIVLLKRLEDAIKDGDHIDAVILGSAVNNDGSLKVGFTAPSVEGQAEVITMAHSLAGIASDTVSLMEAHGTGTLLGDPIEIEALTKAFRESSDRVQFCAIGSVKTNIGHLDAAAGVAGLIKVILALKNKQMPPSINFSEPNPEIDFENSPFFVNTKLREWHSNGIARRAGISAFGVGGTNAHVILEEAPETSKSSPSKEWQLLKISAKTSTALDVATDNLADFMKAFHDMEIADAAFTLQVGRKDFQHRRIVVCRDAGDAVETIQKRDAQRIFTSSCKADKKDVVFMFTGQGSQYPDMGLDLYKNEPVFRESIDKCSRILEKYLSFDLRNVLFSFENNLKESAENLKQTYITQPALFSVEYALANLWMSWGVKPSVMVGHSIGEYVAACLAGVFSLEDALFIVATRGKLIQGLPHGSMLAVFLAETEVREFLNENVSLAGINGPSLCVLSGKETAMDNLEKILSTKKINFRRLHTSHAFHSNMMDPILVPFGEELKKVKMSAPQIPFISNVSGKEIRLEDAISPEYWVSHLRNTVRFSECLQELFQEQNRILLEVGPGNTLSSLARQHENIPESDIVLSSLRHPSEDLSDCAFILSTIGHLWLNGFSFDWSRLYNREYRKRIPLPTYPFEGKRYWIEPGITNKRGWIDRLRNKRMKPELHGKKIHKDVQINESELQRIWSRALGISSIGVDDNFFELGGHSLLAVSIITELERNFGIRLSMASLIEAPTIKEYIRLLEDKKSGSASPYLVPLHAKGSKPPFFLLHSHGGNILEYHPLANLLKDDRPVYAIQCRGLDGSPVEDMDVEGMAITYLKEIRSIQPKGPYYLGGYCFGGYLSLEIAHLLNAENEEVKLMVLINSATRSFNKYQPGMTRMPRILCALNERIALEWDELSGQPMRTKIQRIMMRAGRMYDLTQKKVEVMLDKLPDKFPLRVSKHSLVYHLEKIADANDRAWERYRPKPYSGKVVFLRASRQPSSLMPDPVLGWKDFLTGECHVHEVPGFRQTMLEERHVSEMANIILKHLP